jgi:hypothetical protein
VLLSRDAERIKTGILKMLFAGLADFLLRSCCCHPNPTQSWMTY